MPATANEENVRISVLPNGVRVATSAIPSVQSVSLGIWAGVGGRHEPAGVSGISHFIEHMLFKGTRSRSALEISQAIEGRGGYLNAFTQEESTCYYARVPFDRVNDALDVLSDMYRRARLSPADIDRERQVIVEEIMMYRDQPQHEVFELLTTSLWQGHPLGRPIAGTPETLARIDRAAVSEYLHRMYVPAATVVTFAGRLDHEDCVRAVRRLLGGMRAGRAPTARAAGDGVRQRAEVFRAREVEQTHLAMGFRMFGRLDPRRHTLRVLNAIFGENMSSRLFQRIREQHGLAYSVQSSSHMMRETGALAISAGMDGKNLVKTLRLVGEEVRRMKNRQVPGPELARAKEYCVGQLRLGMESTTSRMMWLGEHLLTHGRVIPPEETVAALNAVTAPAIQRLAREVMDRRRLSLAVVSPKLKGKVQAQASALASGY